MHNRLLAAASLAVAFGISSLTHADFTFDDIHYWVGEGTNQAAVIIDWNAGADTSLAWGYRWNGDAIPAQVAIAAIAHEDRRLVYSWSTKEGGASVNAFGYDRSDVAATFDLESGRATDTNALVGVHWAQSRGIGDAFGAVDWTDGEGVDLDLLSNGAWYAFKRTKEDSNPLVTPLPAESPYGWRIVESYLQKEEDQSYWWDGVYYSSIVRRDPAAALGHPSLHVSGYGTIPDHPVTPGESAWGDDQIVKLVAPDESDDDAVGWVSIEFDHPVIDDLRNPFGLDFLVFSYRFVNVSGGYYSTDDPAGVTPAGTMYAPRGIVEVSQDGATWFAAGLIGTNAFAPTLSHVYAPTHADTNLFSGNLWWGATTDATRPVDPAVILDDFTGMTLAQMCMLYDGSAGGTGFDISALDLPTDSQGRKWIRFVRIASADPGDEISIDAVADVSPAPSFRNWVDEHVAFADRPGYATTNMCANGLPAYVNAALGQAPDTPSDGSFAIESFSIEDGAPVLRASLAPWASDLVRLRWSPSLATPATQWATALPLWPTKGAEQKSGGQTPTRLVVPPSAAPEGAGFYKIELHE